MTIPWGWTGASAGAEHSAPPQHQPVQQRRNARHDGRRTAGRPARDDEQPSVRVVVGRTVLPVPALASTARGSRRGLVRGGLRQHRTEDLREPAAPRACALVGLSGLSGTAFRFRHISIVPDAESGPARTSAIIPPHTPRGTAVSLRKHPAAGGTLAPPTAPPSAMADVAPRSTIRTSVLPGRGAAPARTRRRRALRGLSYRDRSGTMGDAGRTWQRVGVHRPLRATFRAGGQHRCPQHHSILRCAIPGGDR